MAWFVDDVTYFLFVSCHITINHHDMHMTSRTRPSHFLRVTLKLGGPGDEANYVKQLKLTVWQSALQLPN